MKLRSKGRALAAAALWSALPFAAIPLHELALTEVPPSAICTPIHLTHFSKLLRKAEPNPGTY